MRNVKYFTSPVPRKYTGAPKSSNMTAVIRHPDPVPNFITKFQIQLTSTPFSVMIVKIALIFGMYLHLFIGFRQYSIRTFDFTTSLV